MIMKVGVATQPHLVMGVRVCSIRYGNVGIRWGDETQTYLRETWGHPWAFVGCMRGPFGYPNADAVYRLFQDARLHAILVASGLLHPWGDVSLHDVVCFRS